jgi:RNA polymerase sporulation-specific sigma factor
LTPHQQNIIRLRYFEELSQQKTGEILGLTQVKISREEKKILELLRKAL